IWSLVGMALATMALAEMPPATQPATQAVDLSNNTLVHKALAEKNKADAEVETDYQKKLEALKTERQKKVDANKAACVTALKRAETVANTLKKPEEAATIKALAESIAGPDAAETDLRMALARDVTVEMELATSSDWTTVDFSTKCKYV